MTIPRVSAPDVIDGPGRGGLATLLDLLVARLDDAAERPALATMPRGDTTIATWTWLEVVVWLAYVIPTLIAFFWVIRRRDAVRPSARPTADAAVASESSSS